MGSSNMGSNKLSALSRRLVGNVFTMQFHLNKPADGRTRNAPVPLNLSDSL